MSRRSSATRLVSRSHSSLLFLETASSSRTRPVRRADTHDAIGSTNGKARSANPRSTRNSTCSSNYRVDLRGSRNLARRRYPRYSPERRGDVLTVD